MVAISARALFDLEDSHSLFERDGVIAYADYQREKENEVLGPGIAFPLVQKLLALNAIERPGLPRVEVILLSRNSSDTGLRIFNAIRTSRLDIVRAVFTSGRARHGPISPAGSGRIVPVGESESVRRALQPRWQPDDSPRDRPASRA